jgi:hypothetical protein
LLNPAESHQDPTKLNTEDGDAFEDNPNAGD